MTRKRRDNTTADQVKAGDLIESNGNGIRATVTPGDELRQAATLLRELAKASSRGPWHVVGTWTEHTDFGDFRLAEVGNDDTTVAGARIDTEDEGRVGNLSEVDARWIATLNPAIAEPLAGILERTADVTLAWAKSWDKVGAEGLHWRDLARTILAHDTGKGAHA